jgi:eukaryotic-like serine/threonine-protein kinase
VASAGSKHAREIFANALRRDPQERYEFIDDACGGQPALRAEVVSLLEEHIASGQQTDELLREPGPSRHPVPEQPVGRVVGPYVILQELGRGGMGVVYLADDTRLQRRVALKALSPEVGRHATSRERLRREARAAASLSHPGVATVYALEEFGDELFLVCEYVAGRSLRKLLAEGPLPMSQVLEIATQIARTLAAAHAAGVVHRDIKPENIVITGAGGVKVLDFGLARLENQALTAITHTGAILGTPAYMAPEQALGHQVDSRTDLFALGLLVYEMASGTNPFVGPTVTATLVRIVETEAPPLSEVCGHVTPELDRVVARCLRKDPLERHGSTQALADDLERLSHASPDRYRTHAEPADTVNPPASGSRWTPLAWWKFHQATVALTYVLVLYPVWRARVWLPAPWGMLFLLSTLLFTAAAVSLRLHLLFMARFYVSDLAEQHAQTYLWIRLSDAGFATALLAGALGIGTEQPELAMLLVAVGTAAVVGSLVIEPATTRAAFRRSGIGLPAPWKRKAQ